MKTVFVARSAIAFLILTALVVVQSAPALAQLSGPTLDNTLKPPTPAPDPQKQEPARVVPQQPVQPIIPRQTVCTQQYDPVCGRIGGSDQTYSNACFARAAGAEIIASGPCR